ncbi:MAG: hypothetical protein FWE04_04185 [Oscillospiraceae bacterium]|nr:hypothetical protein [Oscillospiraceae bacterium]
MTKKMIAIIAVAAMAVVLLTGCGGGGSNGNNAETLVGEWTLIGIERDGVMSSVAPIQIAFDESGGHSFEHGENFTWSASSGVLTWDYPEAPERLDYRINEDGLLYLYWWNDDNAKVFRRDI